MEDIIFGKNAVKEVLKEDVEINKMLLQKEGNVSGLGELIRLAREKKIVIQDVNKRKLDEISEGGNHQGVIIMVSPFKYVEVEELIKGKESPLLVVLDGIQDPHNLGAIIRTSYAAG
ncbi:MAG: 23S rRNA (guanosine(2251)-2'-O)-methyltransferase RlmB, partial [Clostridiales bacterium]|nr:23S rRNA (guanosine(2251)-2'-O)-methyltransferase RlmB [Clostridiales bacterium]